MILKIDNVTETQLKNLVLFLDGPENLIRNESRFLTIKEGKHLSLAQSHVFKKVILLKVNRDSDENEISSFSLTIKINEGYRAEEDTTHPIEEFAFGRKVIDGIMDALEKFPRR